MEVVDLTREDSYAEPRMESTQRRNFGSPRQGNQFSATTVENASDQLERVSAQDLATTLHSTSRSMPSRPMVNGSNGLHHSSTIRGAEGASPLLGGTVSRSLNVTAEPLRTRRTVPWASNETRAVTHNAYMSSSPRATVPHNGGPLEDRSWNRGTIQNHLHNKGQTIPANAFIENPRNSRTRDEQIHTSQSSNRPCLKLIAPKSDASHRYDIVPPGFTTYRAKYIQNSEKNNPNKNASNFMSELSHARAPSTLSHEAQQTTTTESDSDDASVRMRRSIYQASAKYSGESLGNVESQTMLPAERRNKDKVPLTEATRTPTHQPSKPANAFPGPELGEWSPAAEETEDINLVCESASKSEKDPATLALHSKSNSASGNLHQTPAPQSAPSNAQLTAATTPSKKDVELKKLKDSANEQELQASDLDTSSEPGGVVPDLKLLEAIFKPMFEEMRSGQDYVIAGVLSRARKDTMGFPGPNLNQSLPDPFAAASGNGSTQLSPFGPPRRVRMESRVANVRNKASLIESQAAVFQSEAQRLPKYSSIVRLGSNLLAPNDKDLRYLPYFPSEEEKDGSDAANFKRREELLEGFDHRIKFLPEERKCAEQAEFWREHVAYFLEAVGCTCADVMFYLLHDEDSNWKPECQLSEEALSQWQNRETYCGACGTKFEGDQWDRLSETLSGQKPDEQTLARAGLVCSVFSNAAKFSIWHVVSTDADVQYLLHEMQEKWTAQHEEKRPNSRDLCMLCHVFDCPTHGAYLEDDSRSNSTSSDGTDSQQRGTDHDSHSESLDEVETRHDIRQNVVLPDRPNDIGQQHRCGFFCVDPVTSSVGILGLHANGEVKGQYNVRKDKELGDPGFTDEETCSQSCFWDVSNRHQRTIDDLVHTESQSRFVDWSKKDIVLFRSMLAACTQIRRGPCIMASVLTRPCSVIFVEMMFEIYVIPHPVSENHADKTQPLSNALTNGYKDKHYWSESSQTYDHHKRRPFVPCSHSGPCQKNADCTCWTDKVACEWICGCDRKCSRRFQGCRCIARGAKVCFKDSTCDCWVLNRECDPWLCGKCGVLEVLDPLNRHDDSILRGRCKNAMIQRNIPKRTLKGPSEVHGWGLFAGAAIRANDFIGEYKGEVISEEESNRRGLVYHYRGLEYLFRLNKEQEIDSSRAGNKMRFINNSERPSTINVYAQTMLCNGVQRIGLFAKRNVVAGEEMFFRYGYPESVTKHFWEKEDLEAGSRTSSGGGDELDDDAEAEGEYFKAKAVKASVIAAKTRTKKDIGKQIRKALQRSGGKQRHAHFLDDIADDERKGATLNQRSPHVSQLKKRKRGSSPVIEETILDLTEHELEEEAIVSDLEAAAGPSSSSFGAHTEIAESDSSDEEYEEAEDVVSDEEDDEPSASETETDVWDAGKTHFGDSPPLRSTQTRGSLQTAAARAASLKNRRMRAKTKEDGVAVTNPTLVAGRAAPTTSTSSKSSRSKKTSSSKDSGPARPYTGRKRGRPFGWKKGVDFR
jgi:SET domain/CXC domain